MDLRVTRGVSANPFLSIADLFETESELSYPAFVCVRDNPGSRVWAGHYQDHHVLNISRQAAISTMTRELTPHELSHITRNGEGHVSYCQSTRRVVLLAFAGRTVERWKLTHCYQIANHRKDIYADGLTLSVAPAGRLVQFFESQLTAALADRPQASGRPGSQLVIADSDPEITAMNAGFILVLVKRHDLVESDHRLCNLAHAAGNDAPSVSLETSREHSRTLADDPSKSEYRRVFIDVAKRYVVNPRMAVD